VSALNLDSDGKGGGSDSEVGGSDSRGRARDSRVGGSDSRGRGCDARGGGSDSRRVGSDQGHNNRVSTLMLLTTILFTSRPKKGLDW
jgi:hypothetical protein